MCVLQKRKRNEQKYEELRENKRVFLMEKDKRVGTYKPGMNMVDPNREEDLPSPKKKKAKGNSSKNIHCEWCATI